LGYISKKKVAAPKELTLSKPSVPCTIEPYRGINIHLMLSLFLLALLLLKDALFGKARR
jgi:hypothetical protein